MQSCFHKILFKFKYSFDISERSVNFQRIFWCLQFFQKTNKNKWTWGIIVVFLVRFLDYQKVILKLTDLYVQWRKGPDEILTKHNYVH